MMIFKIITLGLISFLCWKNFVAPLNQFLCENDKYMYAENSNNSQYKLVASLANKNIKLFALSSEHIDVYDNFLLNVNGKIATFKWKSVTSIPFGPKLILSDINNDKFQELIIVMTTGTGSDLHMEEVDIINIDAFNEYPITDPLIIIKEKITTEIIKEDRDVLNQVKLRGNKYIIKKDKTYAGAWFKNVHFGNSIHWEVDNNRFIFDSISFKVSK